MSSPIGSHAAKCEVIQRLARQGQSKRAVHRITGIALKTIRKYWPAEAGALEGAPAPPPPPPPDPVEVERERLERTRRLREEREALRAVAGERSLRAFLEDLVRDTVPRFPAPPPYQPRPERIGATTETLLLVLSDWHAYERVVQARTLGLNDYDADVMGRRLRRITDTVISIKSRMERGDGWRFPRLVVAANGDFVSGTIHEVERHSDAPNIVQAVYGCGFLLACVLRDLAAHFPDIEVFGTSGNHGRLPDARRMQQKDPTRNWDTMVYFFAREMLRDCENIHWRIPDAYTVVYEIGPWRFLQNHGHEIRSWMNIPFYGIGRKVANINAVRSQAGEPVHYCIFSHFHNAGSIEAPGGEYFVNGSLIGGTEFGVESLGRCDPPKQLLLAVHDQHGVTSRWPVLAGPGDTGPSYPVRPWLD